MWSAEQAARAKVDVVLIASDTEAGIEKFRALPSLSKAKWVKRKSQDLLHPGPNLARGLAELCSLVR